MKKFKKIFIAVLTLLLVVAGNIDVLKAAEIWDHNADRFFNDVYVDSNTYNKVCFSNLYFRYNDFSEIYINKIDKADGSSSNYTRVKLHMVCVTENKWQTAKIFTTYKFNIPYEYREYGQVYYAAMGNNPSLDCRIWGYVSTFGTK